MLRGEIRIPISELKARLKKRIYLANKDQMDKIFKCSDNVMIIISKKDLYKEK
jgi:hypothetical protein